MTRIPQMSGPAAPEARVRWSRNGNPHAQEGPPRANSRLRLHRTGLAMPGRRAASRLVTPVV